MIRTLAVILFSILLPNTAFALANSITASSWYVTDQSGKKLVGINESVVRPIASITKLMTVMVVLDRRLDLEHTVPVRRIRNISTSIPRSVQHLSRIELIELALVKSDNLAAYLLCAHYDGLGFDPTLPCVDAMNAKASELGMVNSSFSEPTGLYSTNVSSALDLTKLVIAASHYSVIVRSSDKEIIKVNTRQPKKTIVVNNTNPLVSKYHNFIVSKTGWIRSSGGCIVAMVQTEQGLRVIILLGSKSTKTRIDEIEIIAEQIDREDQDLLYRAFGIEREN